ncbi:MAG TPA: hypothetical protein VGO09_02270, partial [Flavisolibacter sp.]|nr:hypothetical protein [Flavisolibacter sp.]
NSPFADWLRGPLKTWVQDIMHRNEFINAQLITPRSVIENINKVLNAPLPDFLLGEKAWISLMPYFWEKSLKHAEQLGADSFIRL